MTDDTFKLDPEFKAKWLEALRSGKYKQGDGWLQDGDCNCCLGVACRITDVPFDYHEGMSMADFKIGDQLYAAMPPDGFQGMPFEVMNDLADMNDDGKTFPEIADYIEKNL